MHAPRKSLLACLALTSVVGAIPPAFASLTLTPVTPAVEAIEGPASRLATNGGDWQTFTWQAPANDAAPPVSGLDRAGRLEQIRRAQARIVDERLARARDIPPALQAERRELAAASFVKDEFESTLEFQARIKAHNQRVTALNDRIQAFLDSAPVRLPAEELAPVTAATLREVYGDPVISNVKYDADGEVFVADLGPGVLADLGVPGHVALKLSRDRARALKPRLVSSRPELAFEVSSEGALRFLGAKVTLDGQVLALEATDASALAAGPTSTLTVLAPANPKAENRDWVVPQVSIQDPEVARLEKEVIERRREKAREEATRRTRADLEAQLASLKADTDGGPDDLAARLAKATTAPDAHRYAFVVGISRYETAPAVPFADRAAGLFGRLATARLGVPESNLTVLTDGKATGTAIKGRFRSLLNRVQAGDTVYVYYAGHGLPGKDGKETYLAPSDLVEGAYEDPDLRLNKWYADLEGTRAGRIVVVVDSCFSGKTGPKDLIFPGVAPIQVTPTGPAIDPARTTLLLASGGDQFANVYRDRSNRLFSYWLIKGLLDRPDDLAGAFTQARQEVDRRSRAIGPEYTQTPLLVGRPTL